MIMSLIIKNENLITAVIWTLHSLFDNGMWHRSTGMRNLIHKLELDLVGLIESDLQKIVIGNHDTA